MKMTTCGISFDLALSQSLCRLDGMSANSAETPQVRRKRLSTAGRTMLRKCHKFETDLG